MEIKRCTKSFRNGVRGVNTGDLVPATHDLVVRFPQFFEPVGDYVARKFPEHTDKPAADPIESPKTTEPKPAVPAKKTASRRPSPRTKGA